MKASSVFLASLFFLPVMFSSSVSDDSTGAEAQQQQTMSKDERDGKGSLLDDLLGIAGCIHECSSSSSSPSSSSSCVSSSASCCSLSFSFSSEEGHDGVGDVVIAAGTMTLQHSISFDQPTFIHVKEELVIESSTIINTKNLHFVVHGGGTLTIRAPAAIITRDDETSRLPLFEVSGTVRFEPSGSVQALLDGSLRDEGGVVMVHDDAAPFLSDQDIVRYPAVNAITVSRMPEEEEGEYLANPYRKEVEPRPELKVSSAEVDAKTNGELDVSSLPLSGSPYSTPSSSSVYPPSSTSPSSALSPPSSGVVDLEGETIVSSFTRYVDPPGGSAGSVSLDDNEMANRTDSISPETSMRKANFDIAMALDETLQVPNHDGADSAGSRGRAMSGGWFKTLSGGGLWGSQADATGGSWARARSGSAGTHRANHDERTLVPSPVSERVATAEGGGDQTQGRPLQLSFDKVLAVRPPVAQDEPSSTMVGEISISETSGVSPSSGKRVVDNNSETVDGGETPVHPTDAPVVVDVVAPEDPTSSDKIVDYSVTTVERRVGPTTEAQVEVVVAGEGSASPAKLVADIESCLGKRREQTDPVVVTAVTDPARQQRVLLSRSVIDEMRRKAGLSSIAASETEGKGAPRGWGTRAATRHYSQDVVGAWGQLGQVEVALDERRCGAESVDGASMASASNHHHLRKGVNRSLRRVNQNTGHTPPVKDDGVGVSHAREKTIWGVKAADWVG